MPQVGVVGSGKKMTEFVDGRKFTLKHAQPNSEVPSTARSGGGVDGHVLCRATSQAPHAPCHRCWTIRHDHHLIVIGMAPSLLRRRMAPSRRR